MSDRSENEFSVGKVAGQEPGREVEITLVVPVYDEEDNIVPFIKEVKAMLALPHQIVIIYDHDEDLTLRQKSAVLAIDRTVAFVKNSGGRGIVNAIRTGFAAATTRYVVPIMADLSDTPATVRDMYRKVQEGHDLVIASRYCDGGRKVGGPYIKAVLSKIANLSLHKITNIPTHDMTNAFILYRREMLDKIQIKSNGGFEVTMELIAKAYILGYSIAEVPTVNRERASGKSKFKLARWIWNYLYWYFYILIYSVVRRASGATNSRRHIRSPEARDRES
jgi:dolichol-phosphate mannosyltransferase